MKSLLFSESQKTKDDIYLTIIKNAGGLQTLESYIKSNDRRDENIKKYESKLAKAFLENFGFELSKCISKYNFKIDLFDSNYKLNLLKVDFEKDLTPKQRKVLSKIFNHYN